MTHNKDDIIEYYRKEIEKLMLNNEGNIMSVLRYFKQRGTSLYEICKPRTILFGGLVSIENPIFDEILYIDTYSCRDEEISVFIKKTNESLYFTTNYRKKEKEI